MGRMFQVRLNKSRQEKLAFLYKLYRIKSETNSDRFRELLDTIYSEKTDQSNTSTIFTKQQPELEELEGWDCVFRVLIHPYNKISRKKEPMIFCLNPTTRGILKTNELHVAVCKKCHDTKGSTSPPELPAPKKPEKPRPTSKPQTVQKQRKCVDCGCDISQLEDWKTRCLSCYLKFKNPAWQGDGKPLRGSPMDLGMREGARIRASNRQLKEE